MVPLRDSAPLALFGVYCVLLFSLSWGPNLTTYILPAMVFPREVRTTFNGMCAAMGKFGAFVGVFMFGAIAEVSSFGLVMAVCAGISLTGAVVSFLFIKDNEGGRGSATDQGK